MQKGMGFGCFLFGFIEDPGSNDFDSSKYLENLASHLNRVDNLSDLTISGSDDVYGVRRIEGMSNTDNFLVPIFGALIIRFRVYLPTRVQHRLLPDGESQAGAENFDVLISYHAEMPVTYISFELPDDFPNVHPSDAVVFISVCPRTC